MIEELGNIDNNEYLRQLRDAQRAEELKKTKSTADDYAAKSSDKLNISPEARQAQEVKEYTKIVKEQPEVREEVVAEVKQEIADGRLDTDEVLEATVDRLITSL